MSARDDILARLPSSQSTADAKARAAALLDGVERPALEGDLISAFQARLAEPSIAATCDLVASFDQVPVSVARYLARARVAPELYVPPDPALLALDWSGIELVPVCPVDGGIVLSVADAGIAETGSLVFETSAVAPMLPNFLALHHLVVLRRSSLLRWLDDIPMPQRLPRAHYWVTGASGTTDIEGQYVRGAHGPRFLHVVMVAE